MIRLVGHNTRMESYNVAEAKTRLSEILERVSEGEEILLTRRGRPIARVIPAATASNILGAGIHDPNINLKVGCPGRLVETYGRRRERLVV